MTTQEHFFYSINWPTWARRVLCFFGIHIDRPIDTHNDHRCYSGGGGECSETWSCACEKVTTSA